jgi:branched-chain amino acid transport system substrate-binding protein
MKAMMKGSLLTAAIALSAAFAAPAALAQDSVYVPNLSYRTGPFAATGIPLMNGQRDYMLMLNERDGGVNGVKLGYDECETGYNTEKGVECYEKTKAQSILTQPWSTGITLQVLPKTNVDKVPILAPGYGFSPMSDGKTFQWAFNPPSSYWDGASMLLNYVSEGNLDNLKGKKIALIHLDHPYGKEPIPLFESLASKHGFSFLAIPVGLTEMQNQSAQWLQIRRENPDFVFMWGWGAMNSGAINEAIKTRFPMEKFLAIWWSGHDGDLLPAGDGAKGFRAVSWNVPVADAPVLADIKKHVVDAGKSEIGKPEEMNWIFYQRGIMISMMAVEAIKAAQANFNTKVINAEQMRWGLENLNVDEAKLKELGMEGMIVPFKTSCADHTGHAGAWVVEWDGGKFNRVSDLLKPDRAAIEPLEAAKAKEYADANAPWPVQECK